MYLITSRFLHFFLLSVIMWCVSLQQNALILDPLNPKIVPQRNKVTAPSPRASWVGHCAACGWEQGDTAGLSLGAGLCRACLMPLCSRSLLSLFWGFPTCRGYWARNSSILFTSFPWNVAVESQHRLNARCPPNCSSTAFVSRAWEGKK